MIQLPIANYAYSPEDLLVIEEAKGLIVQKCVAKYGMSFTTPKQPQIPPDSPGEDRRYGVTDLETATKYGYHLPPDPVPPSRAPIAMSATLRSVLSGYEHAKGMPRRVHGTPVAPEGCIGISNSELPLSGASPAASVAQAINSGSYTKSLADRTVKAAFASWSTCMKEKGFSYPSPLAPLSESDFLSKTASVHEIAVASADVRCKGRVGLESIWAGAEGRIQQREISEHRTELTNLSKAHAQEVSKAKSIIASSGP